MANLSTTMGISPLIQKQTNVLIAQVRGMVHQALPHKAEEDHLDLTAQLLFGALVEGFDTVFSKNRSALEFQLSPCLQVLIGVMSAYTASANGLSDEDLQLAIAATAIRSTDLSLKIKHAIDNTMAMPEDKTRDTVRREVSALFNKFNKPSSAKE